MGGQSLGCPYTGDHCIKDTPPRDLGF